MKIEVNMVFITNST